MVSRARKTESAYNQGTGREFPSVLVRRQTARAPRVCDEADCIGDHAMKARGMKNLSRRTLILAPPLLWATSRIQAKAECASYTQIQVPLCQATQPPFGSRPATGPLGFSGQSNIVTWNLFFNQSISPQELLEFDSCTNITIMDCDFDTMPVSAAGRRAIYLLSCSRTISILRCRCKQPAHNFIQFDKSHMTGEIAFNKVRGATANSEDLISIFQSGGVDATHRLAIHNNALDGGDPVNDVPGYTSNSGSGCFSATQLKTQTQGSSIAMTIRCLTRARSALASLVETM